LKYKETKMKYNSLNISVFEIAAYVVKLFLTKTFGSTKYVEYPEYSMSLSPRGEAAFMWAHIFHGLGTVNGDFDRNLLLDQIWYGKASEELMEERACWEEAEARIYGNS
jgi:hypothetical protein